MTRTLTVRHPWLGRVIALLVGVCVAFGGLEAMVVPTVHDGDGPAGWSGQAVHGAAVDGAAVDDAARTASGGVDERGASLDGGGVPLPPGNDSAPLPRHSTHVDHCVHAHEGAPPAALPAARPRVPDSERAPEPRDLPHASALRPPLWRPPKA